MIFDFFQSKLGPPRNMRRKTSSRFPILVKVGLKEANAAFASFALSFVQIEKREGFFRRMFRGGPNLDRKIKNHKNVKSKMKKNIGWTCKKYIFSFIGKPSVR